MSAVSGSTSQPTRIDLSDPVPEPIKKEETKEKEEPDRVEQCIDCTKKTVEVVAAAYEVYQMYNDWKKA